MNFFGIRRVFPTENEEQYETIGAFWDEMSNIYGREKLRVRQVVMVKRKSCGAENAHTAYEDIQFCYRSEMLLR